MHIVYESLLKRNYPEVIRIALETPAATADYPIVRITHCRALLEMHKTNEAIALIESSLSENSFSDEECAELNLWKIFCTVFTTDTDPLALIREVQIIQDNTRNYPHLQALALNIQARLKTIAVEWGLASLLKKDIAIKDLGRAALLYLESGLEGEYFRCSILKARWLAGKYPQNRVVALEILHELIEKQKSIFSELFITEIRLLIAEVTTRLHYDNADTENILRSEEVFRKLYEEIDKDEELVQLLYLHGQLLLEYGDAHGITVLKKAIEKSTVRNGAEQQAAWWKIALWYQQHGNEEEYIIASMESSYARTGIDALVNSELDVAGTVHDAFRRGDIGIAEQLSETYLSTNPTGRLVQQIRTLYATILHFNNDVSKRQYGLELRNLVVQGYRAIAPNYFLPNALENLSYTVSPINSSMAISLLEEALVISRQLNDRISISRYNVLLAMNIHEDEVRINRKPMLSQVVTKYLHDAESALAGLRSMEAVVQLGQVYNTTLYLASLVGQYELAENAFGKAEAHYLNCGLRSNLAALNDQYALMLFQKARQSLVAEDFERAEQRIALAYDQHNQMGLYSNMWRSLFIRGVCLYEAGQIDDLRRVDFYTLAERYFAEAATIIDALRWRSYSGDDKALKQTAGLSAGIDKQKLYREAFTLHLNYRKDLVKAHEWLERMKSQALLDAVALTHVPASLLQKEEYIKSLIAKKNSIAEAHKVAELQADIQKAAYELVHSLDSDAQRSKESLRITNWPLLAKKIKSSSLSSKLLIVQYYYQNDEIIIFGFRDDWDEPKLEVCKITVTQSKEIAARFFHSSAGSLLNLLRTGREYEWQKCSALIAPVKNWAKPGDFICFVPHGFIHSLPLHTLKLPEEKQFLIESNPVFYCPSASLLYHLLDRQPLSRNDRNSYAVFGNPTGDLPHAGSEASYIGSILNEDVLLEDQVRKERFLTACREKQVVHFAGHSSPDLKSGADQKLIMANEEYITATDLLNTSLECKLLVLSGCETGVNKLTDEGDELLGLSIAALCSGVSTLVVSQWKVYDSATKELISEFYNGYIKQKLSPPEAMQMAMVNMIKRNNNSFFYWGAFKINGYQ